MRKINDLLKSRDLPGTQIKMANRGGEIVMMLPGGRRQVVHIRREDHRYILASRVITRGRVKSFSSREIAEKIWDRNRYSDVVEFCIDEGGELVGRIEQVADTLDPEEFFFFLRRLAQECDRFEYLLTGKDEM